MRRINCCERLAWVGAFRCESTREEKAEVFSREKWKARTVVGREGEEPAMQPRIWVTPGRDRETKGEDSKRVPGTSIIINCWKANAILFVVEGHMRRWWGFTYGVVQAQQRLDWLRFCGFPWFSSTSLFRGMFMGDHSWSSCCTLSDG